VIESIAKHLERELDLVDAQIQQVLDSDTALVREVGAYVRATQGKRLRPILVLLASQAFGSDGSGDNVKIAASLELVHTATLLHDDVVDKADLRRGMPTVNSRWGDDVAILIADYLFSKAFRLGLEAVSPRALTLVCDVTARMCEGEMFQIEKREELLTRDDYYRIVRNKTAYLFSACTALGATLAGARETEIAQLAQYGLNFGMAFQITDDTLDLVASDADIGKQHWSDIRNGKQTLPLIHTFEVAGPEDRTDLLECWSDGRDCERIMRHVHKYRGVEYALDRAREFAAEARRQLETFPPSQPREMFEHLSHYVVERGK
jgi:octaprenyl-diphosphate synthase